MEGLARYHFRYCWVQLPPASAILSSIIGPGLCPPWIRCCVHVRSKVNNMHYAMNTDYSQLSPLFPLKTSLPQINGCIVTGTGRQQTAVTAVSAHDPDPRLLVLEKVPSEGS